MAIPADKVCVCIAAGVVSPAAMDLEPLSKPIGKGIRLQLVKRDPLEAIGGLHQVRPTLGFCMHHQVAQSRSMEVNCHVCVCQL